MEEDGKTRRKTKEGGMEMAGEEKDGFCHVVESFLERFTHRQTVIIEKWNKVEVSRKETKMSQDQWEKVRQESQTALSLADELDSQLFPVLQEGESIKTLIHDLECRQERVPQYRKLATRLESLAKQANQSTGVTTSPSKCEAEALEQRLRQSAGSVQGRVEEYGQALALLAATLASLDKVEGMVGGGRGSTTLELNIKEAEMALQQEITHQATFEKLAEFVREEVIGLETRFKRMNIGQLLAPDVTLVCGLLQEIQRRGDVGERMKELQDLVRLLKWEEEREAVERELFELLRAVKKLGLEGSREEVGREREKVEEGEARVQTRVARLRGEAEKGGLQQQKRVLVGLSKVAEREAEVGEAMVDAKERLKMLASFWEKEMKARKSLEVTHRHLLAWSQTVTTERMTLELAARVRGQMEEHLELLREEEELSVLENLSRMVGRQVDNLCLEKKDAKTKVEAFISKISCLEVEMVRRAGEEEEKIRIEKICKEEEKTREEERRAAEEDSRKRDRELKMKEEERRKAEERQREEEDRKEKERLQKEKEKLRDEERKRMEQQRRNEEELRIKERQLREAEELQKRREVEVEERRRKEEEERETRRREEEKERKKREEEQREILRKERAEIERMKREEEERALKRREEEEAAKRLMLENEERRQKEEMERRKREEFEKRKRDEEEQRLKMLREEELANARRLREEEEARIRKLRQQEEEERRERMETERRLREEEATRRKKLQQEEEEERKRREESAKRIKEEEERIKLLRQEEERERRSREESERRVREEETRIRILRQEEEERILRIRVEEEHLIKVKMMMMMIICNAAIKGEVGGGGGKSKTRPRGGRGKCSHCQVFPHIFDLEK